MAETAAKRLKTTAATTTPAGGAMSIGTHNGHFHADEALAVHMLRSLPSYASASLVRTRDPDLLASCHTVVDVGGEYDAGRSRFDHHQRGFATTFPGRPTKLSSAGLVYMHFGKEIIARKMGNFDGEEQEKAMESMPEVGIVWNKLYESFVEALDAHDNGIEKYDAAALAEHGIEKRFGEGGFTLGAMVGRLNPSWNDVVPSDPAEAQAAEDRRFVAASRRIGEEFDRELDYMVSSWLPARAIVAAAFAKRRQFDPEGRVVVFEGTSAPWKDHLYSLEEAEGPDSSSSKVLYVLYPEKPVPGARWRVQCVPVSKDSFSSRKPLPEAWRGFRDEELDGVASVEGCVFVHASGFIGGNKTFEGAKAMATKALEM